MNLKHDTWMSLTSLFLTTEIWKQARYPSEGEWINYGISNS